MGTNKAYEKIFGVKAERMPKKLSPEAFKKKQEKNTEDYLRRVYKSVRKEGLSVKEAKEYINRIRKTL